jgi:hypothetical protein
MKHAFRDSGFGTTGAFVALICLVIAGAFAWHIFAKDNKSNKSTIQNTSEQVKKNSEKNDNVPEDPNKISMGSGRVTFKLPDGWEYEKFLSACPYGVTAKVSRCTDGGIIIPQEKITTPYGGGTEFVNASAGVFANTEGYSPRDWLEKGLDQGTVNVISNDSVNGNPAMVATTDSITYHYVISAKGLIVYVRAPLYEAGVGYSDSTMLEPSLRQIVGSIVVQ